MPAYRQVLFFIPDSLNGINKDVKKQEKQIVQEAIPDYEKSELDLIKMALKRSYTERFHAMTRLMKMNIMLRQAKIKGKSTQ